MKKIAAGGSRKAGTRGEGVAVSRVKSYEERQTVALERIASALEKMAPSICAHGENTPCPYCMRDAIMDGISNVMPVIR